MKKYSILVNSCDAYFDTWNPFFRILEKTWPEASQVKIYLNTETCGYKDSFFDIEVLNCINESSKNKWGERLINALDRIDSDYILFLLEDFYFERNVCYHEIEKCIDYMDENSNVGVFSFSSPQECEDIGYCKSNKSDKYPGFVIRKAKGYYKLNAGPSLWRKKTLRKWIFKNDTPWAWEAFGSKRSWFINGQFYARRCDVDLIFDYDIEHGGAVHRGKWVGSKVPELNTKYNLGIDLNLRGIEEEKDFNPFGESPKPMYKRICTIFSNRLNALFGIIYGVFR